MSNLVNLQQEYQNRQTLFKETKERCDALQKEQEEKPCDSAIDYVKKLHRWSVQRSGTTTVRSTVQSSSKNARERSVGNAVVIKCSLLASEYRTPKLDSESFAECQQRAARNFLLAFAPAPFH